MLTLSELAVKTLPIGNWLLVLNPEQSLKQDNQRKLYLSDVSQNSDTFNEFIFDQSISNTFDAGFYEYRAYQMPDGGSEDENTGHLVEIGMMQVIGERITKKVRKSENKVYGR